jgi:LmbE family N-acetylglucosaminyl deacetylase
MSMFRVALLLASAAAACLAQTPGSPVMVVTASSRDWILGAGGTIAKLAAEGRPVYVLQFGNEEKDSIGLGPAETRLSNNEEGVRAAKLLGAREVVNLGHKSGEMAYLSSSEMRNQVMLMMRVWKPGTMFFPDWYVHYQDDNDVYRVGRMAEEAPYGGSGTFLQEFTYIGLGGYAPREYYFYPVGRPYRAGEGGEGAASVKTVDIAPTIERKIAALLELKTSNKRWVVQSQARLSKVTLKDSDLVRAYVEELAMSQAGAGGRFVEQFNHLLPVGGLPAHVRERAVQAR